MTMDQTLQTKPRVGVVLDVPPRLDYPNGYSARYYHFLRALCEHFDVHAIAVEPVLGWSDKSEPDWKAGFFPRDLPLSSSLFLEVGENPLNRPGFIGRALRLWHYLADPLPYMSFPRTLPPEIHDDLNKTSLVCVFLPPMAHLTKSLADTSSIAVLEDSWETGILWNKDSFKRGLGHFIVGTEKRKFNRLYRTVGEYATVIVALSDAEADHFRSMTGNSSVHVLPHAIDCDYFSPSSSADPEVDVGMFGILHSGLTLDGIMGVLSARESRGLSFSCTVAGRSPHDSLLRFKQATVDIVASPKDLRPLYENVRVVVAPAGLASPDAHIAGARTTVLQAWAMGKPLVATPFVAAGLPALDGTNILLASTADEILDSVNQLLADPELRNRLSHEGRKTVKEQRDITRVANYFLAICQTAIKTPSEDAP